MSKTARAMSLLLAVNFETVLIFLFIWNGGEYLNENYPKSFNWMWILGTFGFLAIAHSWYFMFKTIMRMDKEK